MPAILYSGFQDFRRYEWSDRLWVELALVSYLTDFGHGLSWFGASMAAPCRQGTPRRGGQVGCGPVDRCLQPVIEHVLGNPIYL